MEENLLFVVAVLAVMWGMIGIAILDILDKKNNTLTHT